MSDSLAMRQPMHRIKSPKSKSELLTVEDADWSWVSPESWATSLAVCNMSLTVMSWHGLESRVNWKHFSTKTNWMWTNLTETSTHCSLTKKWSCSTSTLYTRRLTRKLLWSTIFLTRPPSKRFIITRTAAEFSICFHTRPKASYWNSVLTIFKAKESTKNIRKW